MMADFVPQRRSEYEGDDEGTKGGTERHEGRVQGRQIKLLRSHLLNSLI